MDRLSEVWTGAVELLRAAFELVFGAARFLWDNFYEELRYALIALVVGLVRAAGKTVQSGQTGLKYSFGRATRELAPGFYPLVPFLQVVRVVATRDRTVDLPQQRVTTLDGLVYDVDANLVFRVVDVRKALIEIDDLDRGMYQVLGLGVQDVLRRRERASLHVSLDLDRALAATLSERLAPWGVEVRRAGFTSIKPTDRTLRVTQLAAVVGERAHMLAQLAQGGAGHRAALALLGHQGFPITRTRKLRGLAYARRRTQRVRRILDEAQAEGLLETRRLPLSWRGAYEERSYLGERFGGKQGNQLLAFEKPAPEKDKAAERKGKSPAKAAKAGA